MVTLNTVTANELAVRVVLESEEHGREYFDHYESFEEVFSAVKRLLDGALNESPKDGIERFVGIAVVPKWDYLEDGDGEPQVDLTDAAPALGSIRKRMAGENGF